MSEATVTFEENIFNVFKDTPEMMVKVQARFRGQYATTDDRTLIALENDKVKLVAIIKKEEDEKAAAEKAAKK